MSSLALRPASRAWVRLLERYTVLPPARQLLEPLYTHNYHGVYILPAIMSGIVSSVVETSQQYP